MSNISIIILTKNEEKDLPKCLNSLSWCDDIHIVDSGSSDDTLKIAMNYGATAYSNQFISFGQQRNWSLDHCDIKYEWILFLDADEESTHQFHHSVIDTISNIDNSYAGFYCCWKMILYGTWLKRVDSFPKWQFRLLRQGRARFTDFGHGQKEDKVDGKIGYIKEPYLHHAFSKGWEQWIDRHNRYSSLEARQRIASNIQLRQILTTNTSTRNKAIKPLVSKIPGWPLMYFLVIYFLKFGFIEGLPGLIYSINMSYYEFLIQIKMLDIKNLELSRK